MNEYNPHEIEARWQARWEAEGRGRVDLDGAARPFYNLMEFPYPSGVGLHVGHVFSFGGADTYGRFIRRHGYDVFQPIGFDAFGIHSENYALKTGAHPRELTQQAIARFRQQLRRLGAAFDWSREVNTSDPAYYRWTQWIFVQLFKAGLAYRAEAWANWCPACLTVLADEQVVEGRCERCDTPMTRRRMTQWFFRITRYAERLLDFSGVDFPEAVIRRQRAWIGRSEGAEFEFLVLSSQFSVDSADESTQNHGLSEACPEWGRRVEGSTSKTQNSIKVFTTRPETIVDATFVALAPEHPLAEQVAQGTGRYAAAVRSFIAHMRGQLELERQQREPEGAFTGLEAINPETGERIPVWVASYVLSSYGTGAVMGVPSHDERDLRFAERYRGRGSGVGDQGSGIRGRRSGVGSRVSGVGGESREAMDTRRRTVVRYRLRDWLISRQRYWGPPIPIIYCDHCGTLPVPEDQLPVLLPPLENFRPTGTGASPLATIEEFVQTSCSQCGGPARRETDVSDNFLDSAWYFLRYISTERGDRPWNEQRVRQWLPVDLYIGGPEHATMHHLYARFITMALHDLGLLPLAEPFARLRLHGTIVHGGRKMSKSRGNVINPDEAIARYGADATRMALLFLGPFEEDADARGFDRAVIGMARFLRRVWDLGYSDPARTENQEPRTTRRGGPSAFTNGGGSLQETTSGQQRRIVHSAVVEHVTEGLESLHFHTAIAALMEYANWLRAEGAALPMAERDEARRTLALLLAPFAPHIAEELWARLGCAGSVHDRPWPASLATSPATIELPVQVDGRLRDRVRVAAGAGEDELRSAALACPAVQQAIGGRTVRRVVVVPGRVVNVVTGQLAGGS